MLGAIKKNVGSEGGGRGSRQKHTSIVLKLFYCLKTYKGREGV